jgi:hypothetical protein
MDPEIASSLLAITPAAAGPSAVEKAKDVTLPSKYSLTLSLFTSQSRLSPLALDMSSNVLIIIKI